MAAVVSTALVVFAPGAAQAAGTPDIGLSIEAPDAVLLGDELPYQLTVTNPAGQLPAYNASFRVVVPAGVTYVVGSTSPAVAGDPRQVSDPDSGETTLIWLNVADVQPGGTAVLGFRAVSGVAPYPVSSTVQLRADAYVASDARTLPSFAADGTPSGGATGSASAVGPVTRISAIEVEKGEPSPEHELLRGVHRHTTVYTVEVRNNQVHPTDDVVLVDLLPAALEYLGCGAVDNSTSVTEEYAGAPALTATPAVGGCTAPTSVDTVVDPAGHAPGVYTQVTYDLGDLAAGDTVQISYRAGIPLRENADWASARPDPEGLGQTANLDNNLGAWTTEGPAENGLTNTASASGTYTGPVAGGGGAVVTDADQLTVTAEDLAVQKSVDTGVFAAPGIATFTVAVRVGEYRQAADVVLSDVLPNGYCPVAPAGRYPEQTGECAASGDGPAATLDDGSQVTGFDYAGITYEPADGTYDLVFTTLPPLAPDEVVTVTYQAVMRSSYSGPGQGDEDLTSKPTAAGDEFVNTVHATGTTTPAPGAGLDDGQGAVPVIDDSESRQTTSLPELDKTIGQWQPVADCDTATYVDTPTPASRPVFSLGDLVCFRIELTLPGSVATRGAVLTDFLPDGLSYEAGSQRATEGNGDPVTFLDVDFNETQAASGAELPTWTMGAPVGGVEYVTDGGVLRLQLAARVIGTPDGDAPDVTGNLAKFRSENSAGEAVSLRDRVDLALAPAPPLDVDKRVTQVTRDGVGTPIAPAAGDGVGVGQGDAVDFQVDVSHGGTPADGNDRDVHGMRVLDVLPTGLTCATVTDLGGATCSDAGAPGRPAATPSTASVLSWTLTAADRQAAGSTTALHYTVTLPANVSVSTVFDNEAGVASYRTDTNRPGGATADWYPADNLDTSVTGAQVNAPAADDTSSVRTADVAVTKTQSSPADGPGNDAAGQATIGEVVTYTVRASVPARTTVYGGVLRDVLPAGLTVVSVDAGFSAAGASPAADPLPSGTVPPSTSDPRIVLPATYVNPGPGVAVFELTVGARVSTSGTNVHARGLVDTGRFASDRTPGGTALPARTAAVSSTVVEPAPTVTKASDATGPVGAGQDVTYTVTVGNAAGRPAAHDVVVTDCLPGELAFDRYVATPRGTSTAPVPGNGSNGCGTGTTRLSWQVGSTAGGESLAYTYVARPAADAIAGEAYTNTVALVAASLAGDVSDPRISRSYGATASADLDIAPARITKSVVPTSATVGQQLSYTLTVVVPARVTVYDAHVTDVLPVGIEPGDLDESTVVCTSTGPCTVPPLSGLTMDADRQIVFPLGSHANSAGARTITVTYPATVADDAAVAAGDELDNTAQLGWFADSDHAGDSPVLSDPAEATVTVLEPVVTVTKAADDATVEPGQVVTYTVTATNGGTSAAHDVLVVDTLPAGLTVRPATVAPGTYDPATRRITWTEPTLAAGAGVVRTYQAVLADSTTLDDGDVLGNQVLVSGYGSLPGGGREYGPTSPVTEPVTPLFPALTAVKSMPDGADAPVGEPFRWRIGADNAPSAGHARAVELVDTLPVGWAYVAGSARSSVDGGPETTLPAPEVTTTGGAQVLRFTDVADLAPGSGLRVTYSAVPTADSVGQPLHRNTVSVIGQDATGAWRNAGRAYGSTWDGVPGSPPASADADLEAAVLVVTKTHDPSVVALDALVPFTLTVRNAGPSPAQDVTVTDRLPAGLVPVSAGGPGWDCPVLTGSETAVTCELQSTLAPGASAAVTVTARVDPAAFPVAENSAEATATSPHTGGGPVVDRVLVPAEVDLAISRGWQGPVAVGSPAVYELRVVNAGRTADPGDVPGPDGTVSGPITVVDELPAGLTYTGVEGAGWSCSATGQRVTCRYSGGLAAGAGTSFRVTVAVDARAFPQVDLVATVSSGAHDVEPGNDTAPDSAAVAPLIDVALAKTVQAADDGALVWRLRVSNAGLNPATGGIRVTDDVPAGLQVRSAAGDGWTCVVSGSRVSCDRAADLAPGAQSDVLVTTTAPTGDDAVTNRAAVSWSGGDADAGNNSSAATSTPVGGASGLAATGAEVLRWTGVGVALLLAGTAALVAARSRRHS
ncbi:isopeptide-forming domain-containing fimbrial protein [Modestobacter versicolor]|uniref:isopeptide-forming domain-containing fimbrial protein n=1 Tax=Modestobacter versicolor TaxID=429133 RepID=UPI0034DF2EA9